MRTTLSLLSLALLVACGPSAAEREADMAARKADKECARTYSSLEKAYQDKLYSMGKADVSFVEKETYVKKCVELGLSGDALRCVDPNLAEGADCQSMAQADKDHVKTLVALMLSPMKKDDGAKKAEAATEGGAEGAAAGGEAPAEGGETTEGGEATEAPE